MMTKLDSLSKKWYLTDDIDEIKNAKDTKKFVLKQKLKSKVFKNFLEANQLEKE